MDKCAVRGKFGATFGGIWENFEAVNTFAYKGKQHATIVRKTREKKWYKEDLFSRFYLLSDTTIKSVE